MSDIFNEVDEEVRREKLKQLWERYGFVFIGFLVLIVAAVGGWRFYEWSEAKRATETGAAFEAAGVLSEQGKNQEAEAAFAKISGEGTPSYRTLAKLREAAELSRRDAKAAVAAYDAFAADGATNQVLRDLAALRAGYLLIDADSSDDVRRRLEPLTGSDRAFRHSARALLALAAWKSNDAAALKRWSDMVLADAETPSGTRGQIDMLLVLSAADGKT